MKRRALWFHKLRGLNITKLMARDGDRCAICREPLNRKIKDRYDPFYVTFDHRVPVSAGGLSTLDNLQLAHRFCNQERGNAPWTDEEELDNLVASA